MADPDLLLVRPPARRGLPGASLVPPLGLLYVGAAARAAGYRTALIDAPAEGLGWGELARRCRAEAAAVLGLGSFSPTFDEARSAAHRLRGPATRLVIGGVHATRHGDAVLGGIDAVDAVVEGEAEATIGPLLDWFAGDGRGRPPAGVRVRGQPYRQREREQKLDRLPIPARDLVDPTRYRYPLATRPGLATLMTGRGCAGSCVFCDKTVTGARPRLHSAPRVVDELTAVAADPRVGYAVLFDDDFLADRGRVETICQGILDARLDLHWKCEARADAVDEPTLRLMRRAGCRMLAMGVESSRDDSLNWLGKGVSVRRIRTAFEAARRAGIDTVAYVLVGIPGETPEDVLSTAAMCRELGARWIQFSTLSPYPGTPLYAQAIRNGWLADSRVRNPADAERLRPTLLAPPWTEDRLRSALWRAHTAAYLRPRVAVDLARAIAGGAPIAPLARASGSLAGWMVSEGWRIAARGVGGVLGRPGS